MKYIADLHIHSHFSLATSKELTPQHLDKWARIKGIKIIGTGDITHPKWLAELKENMQEAEQGLYKLKEDKRLPLDFVNPDNVDNDVRFVLSGEISCIYKKAGKTRKVHNIILVPSFEIAEKLQQKLQEHKFNITSDGRPMIGFDSRDLLELCLSVSQEIFLIPAHIWTPWFSVLGDKSGFETVEECYGDLTSHIHALEIGLSANPPMNWMCSFLDKFTLLSNSDAHSPEKLGRNANIFDTDISFDALINSMKIENADKFKGTINFFPQEGKYHYAGHRKCNVCYNPVETLQHKGLCSVCGKPVVVGVMNRVVELSDRDDVLQRSIKPAFHHLIPLKELLSEIYKTSTTSKKVTTLYQSILKECGPELNLLMHDSIDLIKSAGGEQLAEAIQRMRHEEVFIEEGYDGDYGKIKVFTDDLSIKATKRPLLNFDLKEYHRLKALQPKKPEDNQLKMF